MKKTKKIVICFMMLVFGVSLFGCGLYSNDQAMCDKNLKKLINAIENKDNNAVNALFASNKIADIEGFDDSVNELFSYFEGDYVSMRGGPGGTYSNKNDDIIIKQHNMYYTIQTTVCAYKVAIEWCVEYTENPDNVGILSLYIIKEDDDKSEFGSYIGDGANMSGIHIGMQEPSVILHQLVDAVKNQARDEIKELFSPKKVSGLAGFDDSIEELISYYENDFNAKMRNPYIMRGGTYRDKIFYKISYVIFDDYNPRYFVAAEWHFKDNVNSDNIGLWSLSILKYEDTHNLVESYWGDGNFTPGIHVAMPKTADSLD